MVVVTTDCRRVLYLSISSSNVPLVISGEPKCRCRVVDSLLVLDTELSIAPRRWALKANSVLIEVSKIDVKAGAILLTTEHQLSKHFANLGSPREYLVSESREDLPT